MSTKIFAVAPVSGGLLPRWQFISQGATPAEHLFYIQLALEAGCRWVQLRLKAVSEPEMLRTGRMVRRLCTAYGARFIVNDYVSVVRQVQADGVHLGLSDGCVAAARRELGRDCLIGGTANTASEVEARAAEAVDYIGLGPYRFTRTKKKLSPLLGLEGYRKILAGRGAKGITCPVFAIGGIGPEDLPLLSKTGIDGVAVSGWLCRQVDLAAWRVEAESLLRTDNAGSDYALWKSGYPDRRTEIFQEVKKLDNALQQLLP